VWHPEGNAVPADHDGAAMTGRARGALLLAGIALALGGCGGEGDGGGDGAEKEEPAAVTKNESDERLLRVAVDNYRRDTTRLIAAIRSGLNKGDYDNDLNNDVYELRGAIYGFDQALRRIAFTPSAEVRVTQILENDVVAIGRLDPIIDASRWPKDTEQQVQKVLGDIEDTKAKVDALLGSV
jgi:hypothetical protein